MNDTKKKKAELNSIKDSAFLSESIRYILIGVTTTLVNIGIFQGLLLFGADYRIANLCAVVLCKIYGFFANKIIVFRSHSRNMQDLLAEVARFVCARGFSGIVDYFGLIIAVELIGFDKILSKYLISILVIVINYLMGKFVVFRRKKDADI